VEACENQDQEKQTTTIMKLSNLLSLVVVAVVPSIIEAAELSTKVCKPTNTCVGCWGDCVRVGNKLKCCTWYRPSAEHDTKKGENLDTEDQDAIDANSAKDEQLAYSLRGYK
jgi:hypothetical protein